MIVEVALGRQEPGRPEEERQQVLGRGLARAAGHADRPARGTVGGAPERWTGARRAGRRRPAAAAQPTGSGAETSAELAPARGGATRKSCPSRREVLRATNICRAAAGGCPSRIPAGPRGAARSSARRSRRRSSLVRRRACAPASAFASALIPISSRTTWRSSNGSDGVGEFLVALVALARHEQAVAGPRRVEGQADRPAAVVDPGDLLRARRLPACMSAKIWDSGSPRGLSAVAKAKSANSCTALTMSGRFVRSRLPPQPKTTSSRPGVIAPKHPERVAQGVVGVGVVDEHVEGLALLDPLHAARDSREIRARRGEEFRRDRGRSPRRSRRRPSRLLTL